MENNVGDNNNSKKALKKLFTDIDSFSKDIAKNIDDDTQFVADNITATITIKMSELKNAMTKIHSLTKADNFNNAMSLVWYKFDPTQDKETGNMVSMIATLYRCELDGTIKPPISLADFYQQVNNLVVNTNATGIKPII
jgi:hypothetical protein